MFCGDVVCDGVFDDVSAVAVKWKPINSPMSPSRVLKPFCEMNEEALTVHIHKNLRLLILRYISVILYHHHQ